MSGGPAVVDSLAEFEKRFGWPTEPFNLLDSLNLLPNWPWQAMAPSPPPLGIRLHAPLRYTPPMGQAILGLACCDPSRFKIAPALGLSSTLGALHSLVRVCHVTVTLSAA